MSWSRIRKAVVAALVAGFGAALGVLQDGKLDATDVGTVAAAIAVAAYATWRVPNAAAPAHKEAA